MIPKAFGLISVTWKMHDTYKDQEYKAKTIFTIFGTLGGNISMFEWVAFLIIGFFADFNFDNRLIGRLYGKRKEHIKELEAAENEPKHDRTRKMAFDIKEREQVTATFCSWCMAENWCCQNLCARKHNASDLTFRDASRKLNHELDVCELIKTIRVSRLLAKT